MYRTSTFALLMIGFAYGSTATAACSIKVIAEIPVSVEHNRPHIDGRINGQAVRILLDTGSTFSFVTAATAKRLELRLVGADGLTVNGVGGRAKAFSTYVKRLEMGNFPPSDLTMIVLESNKENARRTHRSDLVLGQDFFSNFVTEFDFAHGIVRLLRTQDCRPEQLAYWSKQFSMVELDRYAGDSPSIPITVSINGKPVAAELDSGAQTSVLTRAVAESVGMSIDDSTRGAIFGVSGKPVESWIGTFSSLEIGDNETIQNAKLRVADLFSGTASTTTGSHINKVADGMPSMLIGCDFFMSHRIVVLPAERKLLFSYNGGAIFQAIAPATPSAESDDSETPF